MNATTYWILTLLALPTLLGTLIAFAKLERAQVWADEANDWILKARSSDSAGEKTTWRRMGLWALWPLEKVGTWTESIEDSHLRAGTRSAGWGYLALTMAGIVGMAIYAAVVVVIGLAMLAFALWLLGAVFSDGSSESGARRTVSREKRDLWGTPFTETEDEDGNVVARSHSRTTIWGDRYVEHVDADGFVVGESSGKTGIFGDEYTEHKDRDGQVVGRSEGATNVFGDRVTLNRDADGEVVSKTTVKSDWLGDKYSETK